MPKKSTSKKRVSTRQKQKQKQSQKVVINIDTSKAKGKRTYKRTPKKETYQSSPVVVPNVIYQTIAPNIPTQFQQEPVKSFEVEKPKQLKDYIVEPVKVDEIRKPEYVELVDDIDKIGDKITKDEFIPTANFPSVYDILKSQEPNEELYKKEPFDNIVYGNSRFGEIEGLKPIKTSKKIQAKPMISEIETQTDEIIETPKKIIKVKKEPKKEFQEAGVSAYNIDKMGIDQLQKLYLDEFNMEPRGIKKGELKEILKKREKEKKKGESEKIIFAKSI